MNTSSGSNDDSSTSGLRRINSRGFETMSPLPNNFVPSNNTVMLGRGKKILSHSGNLIFKQIVATKLNAYLAAESRVDKSAILTEVIDQVRQNNPNGGFVKQNPKTGQYFEVGDFLAKEKTAQAFRDALHEFYSSSNPSKRKRRIQSTATPDKTMYIEEEDEAKASPHNEHTLVQAMRQSFSRRMSKSAPSSPTHAAVFSGTLRSFTPPPSFTRLVSSEINLPTMAMGSLESFSAKRRRQSSVIFLGDTLAEFSSSLNMANIAVEDDFEPIPLSEYDQVVDFL